MAVRSQPSSDIAAFREILSKSEHVAVLSGAGVSAESGIPTFRGSGGFWRTYQAQDLATPGAFARDPSLVWEFYHYRRELVLTKEPNKVRHQLNYFSKYVSVFINHLYWMYVLYHVL
jgi:NAD-dependent deacetylase sirtuin 5